MTYMTSEVIGWAAFGLSFGIGLVVLGWYLGLHERDQRLGCELSRERTRAAIAEEMQRRAESLILERRDVA